MKIFTRLILIFLASSLILTSCEKDESIFARENDKLFVDCTEQSIDQIILSNGEWFADVSEVDWITVTPDRGTGNGIDFAQFTINVAYNSGAAREGTIYMVHDGNSYPITVTQEENKFSYGTLSFDGNLFLNLKSTAKILIPYNVASGSESVQISGNIIGAAKGLSIPTTTYSEFQKGNGLIEIPVVGAAEEMGAVEFEIFINGALIGSVSTIILEDPNAVAVGFPVGWNFYSLDLSPRASEYDYSWTTDAISPVVDFLPQNGHKVAPSLGNKEAYLTAFSNSVASVSNYSFNPSIQIRGLMENDYFYCVIPVKNIKPTHRIQVEASMGSAGSAAGYYALEYSDDGKVWHLADGATEMEVFGISAPVHYFVPSVNTSDDRKTYNKETDQGYRKYSFNLDGIKTIHDGNLYLRLRVCMDRRTNGSETTNTIGPNTWADLKGFEIELIED